MGLLGSIMGGGARSDLGGFQMPSKSPNSLAGGGFTGLMDMLNGGGPGQSGDTFKGGFMSEPLNKVGVNPVGTQAPGAPVVDIHSMTPQQREQLVQQLRAAGMI